MRHATHAGAHPRHSHRGKALRIRQRERGPRGERHVLRVDPHGRCGHRGRMDDGLVAGPPARCYHRAADRNRRLPLRFLIHLGPCRALDDACHPAAHDAAAVRRVHDRLHVHLQDTALHHANLKSLPAHFDPIPPMAYRKRASEIFALYCVSANRVSAAVTATSLCVTSTIELKPNLYRWLASERADRKSTRLNSSHGYISYAVFCLKKKKTHNKHERCRQTPHA